MKHFNSILSGLFLTATVIASSSALADKKKAAANEDEDDVKKEYRFRQPDTPVGIIPINTVVYTYGPWSVHTMRGDILHLSKKSVIDFGVNPANTTYFVIHEDKKGRRDGALYSTQAPDDEIIKFDVKKYGNPSAVVYTPDARKVCVATESGLYIFDPRKMVMIDRFDLPFVPTSMAMSNNGYYLAIVNNDRVAVFNFEEKSQRRDWSYGTEVNDVTFNNESSEFAVLTNDGLLTIYDTRSFNIKTDIDNLGEGKACAFNEDGKYMAVAISPTEIELINLVRPDDRNTKKIDGDQMADLAFIKDSSGNSILVYGMTNALGAQRISGLEPSYNKLVASEVDQLMEEWQKMMPGESMEDYKLRVNEETRAKQRRLFEDEISTQLAGDLLSEEKMSLGSYDRVNQLLALDFSSMPTIYLPVPENDVNAFRDADDLLLSDVQYGVLPDDTFEIVYAKVFNKADGKTYEYNNHDRVKMDFLESDANVVSLEVLQQQQMEEVKLQELREKVVEEARENNVITGHTNIAVDSKVVPDYDANGNKILNYDVTFTYQVEPEFSAAEDFPPGKYHVNESGAASSMLKIVKEAFEGEFAQHLKPGQKVKIEISGTADATPIIRTIAYDGSYGDFEEEPIIENGNMNAITVTKADGVKENRQLAFLRAQGVKDFLEKNISTLKDINPTYTYKVDVSEGKGSEFRRITAHFTIIDVF